MARTGIKPIALPLLIPTTISFFHENIKNLTLINQPILDFVLFHPFKLSLKYICSSQTPWNSQPPIGLWLPNHSSLPSDHPPTINWPQWPCCHRISILLFPSCTRPSCTGLHSKVCKYLSSLTAYYWWILRVWGYIALLSVHLPNKLESTFSECHLHLL